MSEQTVGPFSAKKNKKYFNKIVLKIVLKRNKHKTKLSKFLE